MHNLLRITAIMSLFLLASCGGGSDASQEFADACVKGSNMGEELCECIADLAVEELTPRSVAFLAAGMNQDQEGAQEIADEMEVAESMAAGMFMLNGPARCAKDLDDAE